MNLKSKLSDIGLSEKEARVYLTLLEFGSGGASEISREAKVNRATTYTVLDSLAELGLVSSYESDGTTQFIANSPDALESVLENKREEIEKKERKLEDALPELKSLHNSEGSKPVIRYFEERAGLLQSYKEFLSQLDSDSNETIKYLYSRDKIENALTKSQRNDFQQIRLNKKIKSEVIYTYSKRDLSNKDKGDRIKVNSEKFPISMDLEIYGDEIFLSTLEEDLSAILIKNKDIADSMKTLFRLAQIGARAVNQENDASLKDDTDTDK